MKKILIILPTLLLLAGCGTKMEFDNYDNKVDYGFEVIEYYQEDEIVDYEEENMTQQVACGVENGFYDEVFVLDKKDFEAIKSFIKIDIDTSYLGESYERLVRGFVKKEDKLYFTFCEGVDDAHNMCLLVSYDCIKKELTKIDENLGTKFIDDNTINQRGFIFYGNLIVKRVEGDNYIIELRTGEGGSSSEETYYYNLKTQKTSKIDFTEFEGWDDIWEMHADEDMKENKEFYIEGQDIKNFIPTSLYQGYISSSPYYWKEQFKYEVDLLKKEINLK